ncbi:hypothetical protein BRC85_01555 [Halobacteriales archaeon QS_1_69_70]|nr:MAG: hypothetical protein BRC85_01555 [Halobacteriales archaeon QS_1_69_70]
MTVDPEWVNPSSDPEAVRRLVDELDCSHVLASVFVTREVTGPAAADRWLWPSTQAIHDPGGLGDLDLAVDRLASAVTGVSRCSCTPTAKSTASPAVPPSARSWPTSALQAIATSRGSTVEPDPQRGATNSLIRPHWH